MNIITSKSFPKDRYDYLAYQLGVDPQVVFDRNLHKKFEHHSIDSFSYLYFCGKVYKLRVRSIEYENNTNYADPDQNPLHSCSKLSDIDKYRFEITRYAVNQTFIDDLDKKAKEIKLPYFIVNLPPWADFYRILGAFFPLSNFSNFSLTNEEIYTEVYNWLLKCNEPKPVEVANDVKIQQAGFDLKTSFRGTNQCKKLNKKC